LVVLVLAHVEQRGPGAVGVFAADHPAREIVLVIALGVDLQVRATQCYRSRLLMALRSRPLMAPPPRRRDAGDRDDRRRDGVRGRASAPSLISSMSSMSSMPSASQTPVIDSFMSSASASSLSISVPRPSPSSTLMIRFSIAT